MTKLFRISILASAAAVATTPAMAQNAPAPDDESVGKLQEIIVTATRRSESLQKIPLSITALTETSLRDAGISNTRDLQITTPGLNFQQAGGGFAQPYIRGIGTEITTPGSENSVPIFIDDVYMSQSLLGIQQLAGVERIEVLKGPQGTLYGRNASGGAINIQTKNPGRTPEADLSLSYGNYNAIKAQAYMSAPLSDRVAANLSASYENRDGFGKFINTGMDVNDLRYYNLRAKVLFNATDNFDIMVTGHYFDKDDHDHLGYTYTTQFGTSPLPVAVGGRVTFNSRDLYSAFNNLGSKVQAGGGNLHMNWHLGSTTIRSVTSYAKMKNLIGVDYVSSDIPIFNFQAVGKSKTFTQSLYADGSTGAFNWNLGAQYVNDTSSFGPNYVFTAGPDEPSTAQYATVKTESIAAFAEGTYAFTDVIKLTGGIRVNRDRKTQSRLEVYEGPGLGTIANPLRPEGALISTTPRNGRTFNSVTFKVSPQFQINPDLLLYAKVETGFKSGTYNAQVPFNSVAPEKVTSYEAGLKSELADGRLRINLAGFYYNLRNLQVFFLDPNSGATLIQSAPKSRIYGADLEVTAKPTNALTISAGASYLNAKYRDYIASGVYIPNPDGIGNQSIVGIDVSGNSMTRAPKFTGNVRATYDFPLSPDAGALRASAQYFHSGSSYSDVIERFKIESHDIVNASLEYTLPYSGLSAEIWGRNLTNKFYLAYATIDPFGDRGAPNDPRTYGITLRYKY